MKEREREREYLNLFRSLAPLQNKKIKTMKIKINFLQDRGRKVTNVAAYEPKMKTKTKTKTQTKKACKQGA